MTANFLSDFLMKCDLFTVLLNNLPKVEARHLGQQEKIRRLSDWNPLVPDRGARRTSERQRLFSGSRPASRDGRPGRETPSR